MTARARFSPNFPKTDRPILLAALNVKRRDLPFTFTREASLAPCTNVINYTHGLYKIARPSQQQLSCCKSSLSCVLAIVTSLEHFLEDEALS